MRALLLCFVVGAAAPAWAQVQSRPTDAPIVTADHDAWYVQGDPIQVDGNTYYRAGAAQFFDGNRMVRTAHFNGVPLYADTTVEPFSEVLVPIGRGLMQPYERRRDGELAGTTGSRTPSFPVAAQPQGSAMPAAPISPTNASLPAVAPGPSATEPGAVGTRGIVSNATRPVDSAPPAPVVRTTREMPRLRELGAVRQRISVGYLDQQWVSAGVAVAFASRDLVQVGEFAGRPVYTRSDLKEDVIYLPTLGGLVAPYALRR